MAQLRVQICCRFLGNSWRSSCLGRSNPLTLLLLQTWSSLPLTTTAYARTHPAYMQSSSHHHSDIRTLLLILLVRPERRYCSSTLLGWRTSSSPRRRRLRDSLRGRLLEGMSTPGRNHSLHHRLLSTSGESSRPTKFPQRWRLSLRSSTCLVTRRVICAGASSRTSRASWVRPWQKEMGSERYKLL